MCDVAIKISDCPVVHVSLPVPMACLDRGAGGGGGGEGRHTNIPSWREKKDIYVHSYVDAVLRRVYLCSHGASAAPIDAT